MAMVILALGSNLGDKLDNLRSAVDLLKKIPNFLLQQISPLYFSAALLPPNTPGTWNLPYVNLVLKASCSLAPLDLLAHTKAIELSLGRKIDHLPWSPRTIDIDILAWGEENIIHPELSIPHPRMLQRAFVLLPLRDLSPNWRYPGIGPAQGKNIIALCQQLTADDLRKIKPLLHRIDTPQLIGIINLTPNSFSADGTTVTQVLAKVTSLSNTGSTIIDIGAEATNPNAPPITAEQELERLLPALKLIQDKLATLALPPKISIDTRHASVAQAALALGVDYINDVSGLQNPAMIAAIRQHSCKVIIMHSLSVPAQKEHVFPAQIDVVKTVYQWAEQKIAHLEQLGIARTRIIFDVGIGFGKTAEQSLELIKHIHLFKALQVPLLVGHSRKSFLTPFTHKKKHPSQRDPETALISWYLAQQEVDYLRVHNVALSSRFFKLGQALATADTV